MYSTLSLRRVLSEKGTCNIYAPTFRIIPLVTFVIASFYSTALTATTLGFTCSLAGYLETLVILEARCVPKVSFALITADPSIVRDAWRNGRVGIA
jgi:hypothetical protein